MTLSYLRNEDLRNDPWCRKTTMIGLSDGDTFSRFETNHACHRRTDGQTELPWHIRAAAYSLSRVKRIKLANTVGGDECNCTYAPSPRAVYWFIQLHERSFEAMRSKIIRRYMYDDGVPLLSVSARIGVDSMGAMGAIAPTAKSCVGRCPQIALTGILLFCRCTQPKGGGKILRMCHYETEKSALISP